MDTLWKNMMILINYKHKKHLYDLKQIVDLQGKMVPIIQKWNKIVDYL
jgi:hypothetical protein